MTTLLRPHHRRIGSRSRSTRRVSSSSPCTRARGATARGSGASQVLRSTTTKAPRPPRRSTSLSTLFLAAVQRSAAMPDAKRTMCPARRRVRPLLRARLRASQPHPARRGRPPWARRAPPRGVHHGAGGCCCGWRATGTATTGVAAASRACERHPRPLGEGAGAALPSQAEPDAPQSELDVGRVARADRRRRLTRGTPPDSARRFRRPVVGPRAVQNDDAWRAAA